ncbi:MAG: DUF2892 domain-containing protein [Puniceicoccaceae bacterium]|nr:MAG: DUF2892 domain-containing protein [Puniceicoccaceae bacterium]
MDISANELHEKIRDGAKVALIDVRTPAEHGAVHIEGSHLMPLDRLDTQAAGQLTKDAEVCILVCASGKRAATAMEKLAASGCEKLQVLDGGVTAWEQAGLPVKRGAKAISLERQVRIGAGALVLMGVVLGQWVYGGFYALSAFVGAGLIFAGVTDWCGMAMLLAKMPWNQRSGNKCAGNSCST